MFTPFRSSCVNVNQNLVTSLSSIFQIHSLKMLSASSDCQFIFEFTVFRSIILFNQAKYFSTGAISGMYGGIKATIQSCSLKHLTVSLLLWVDAFSSMTKHLFFFTFHLCSTKLSSPLMNFKNIKEFTEPLVEAANTFSDEVIAVIRDVELLYPIFISSFACLFFDQEYLNFVFLEKEDSSILIRISNWERIGIILIAK